MFEKINFKLKDDVDFERLKGQVVTSYGSFPRPILTYYKLADSNYLESILPDQLPWGYHKPLQIQIAEMVTKIPGFLHPHIDHKISVCANFYVTTMNSKTQFFDLKEGQMGFVYPGQKTANLFELDQVKKISEFRAEQGDMYLLDVSKIHSVETREIGVRRFITWQWVDVPYEEVRKSLRQNRLN